MTKVTMLRRLQDIVSADRVLPKEKIPLVYRFDGLRAHRGYPKLRRRGYRPSFLVRPVNAREILEIVRLCKRARVPVVAYGGGSGLMGAAVALHGGVLVDTTRMNRVEKVSKDDMLVQVQAGAVLEDIHLALDREALLFAHDPWSRPIATLGGGIATNSLGYLGSKYGAIGDQLLGLEIVLPTGQVLRTRSVQHSSTGLSLKHLFIGTEGCFGLATNAVIRAFPKPERFALASYRLPSFEGGHRSIMRLRSSCIRPSMLDFGQDNPLNGGANQLYLAFDGLNEEVNAQMRQTDLIMNDSGGERLSDSEAQDFWDHRHDIALRFKHRVSRAPIPDEPNRRFDYLHVSLPASKVPDFYRELLHSARSNRIILHEVGLWHGPELFSAAYSYTSRDGRAAAEKLWKLTDKALKYAQDLGGSMEYCHGVGLRLARLMRREHGLGLALMRRIKETIDPLGIMNPGKAGL